MHNFSRYCVLTSALLGMTVLVLSREQRLSYRAASQPSINAWSILELADHLNREGLQVRFESSCKNGAIGPSAYLTTTEKHWDDLNRLYRNPRECQKWHGTVHCQRLGRGEPALDLWDDHYVVAGPFVFYGDRELLERIGAILAPSTASVARRHGTVPSRQ